MAIDCKANSYRIPRLALAFAILTFCVFCLLASRFTVCNVETVTEKGEATVTKTCAGPTITDAGTVAVALLVILLLVPDMSEVGVFGVSLKRRLEAAEKKADASETKAAASEQKAERLELQLQAQTQRLDLLSQNLAHASAQGIGNMYIISGETIDKADENMRTKVDAFVHGRESTPTFAEPPAPVSSSDPTMVVKLLENWEKIKRFDTILPATELGRFRTVFEQELQIVQAARNTVAHSRPISASDLEKAVDISDQLVEILRRTPWGH
ncbi:hypothetical protein [[Mycobacterium] burgundiense]|uniref:Swt1-like HEPN domain-containing protein n=1 Tax=[Mycobacterium] burgundiense TaxID=3064286 RepID=A0ABM9LH54_9MYCO|nr:hypothetical protein [Mycolicibacterium sp. MU0053]CAJ1498923.1 hypothetical protein MU0053_001279 [Mycolicibacterium sp. MU0053]